jgi:uncharacterized paraquat-inducible protein A
MTTSTSHRWVDLMKDFPIEFIIFIISVHVPQSWTTALVTLVASSSQHPQNLRLSSS